MRFMEEYRLHEAMMGQRMMFGRVISKVVAFWGPKTLALAKCLVVCGAGAGSHRVLSLVGLTVAM